MPEDESIKVERINIHEPDNVRDWAKRLGVEEGQLKETIQAVGTSVDAVKKALAERALRKA